MNDPNHLSCWCPHNCSDIDKRIDERIAKALERLAWTEEPHERLGVSLLRVAAELRAAEPASEPSVPVNPADSNPAVSGLWQPEQSGEPACKGHSAPAPPPSLAERLRSAVENKALDIGAAWSLLDEAADALSATMERKS